MSKKIVTSADIRTACRRKRLEFKPWETLPWDADPKGPPPAYMTGDQAESYRRAQKLRRQITDELLSRRPGVSAPDEVLTS